MQIKTEKALRWIAGLLERHGVPYRITGGLAARIYGVERPLADIDIELPFDQAGRFFDEIRSLLPEAVVHLQNENWDLIYYTFSYEGQEIDLSDTEHIFIRGGAGDVWTRLVADFNRSEWHEICDCKVPVIAKDDLIAYKRILKRDVDLADIAQLEV